MDIIRVDKSMPTLLYTLYLSFDTSTNATTPSFDIFDIYFDILIYFLIMYELVHTHMYIQFLALTGALDVPIWDLCVCVCVCVYFMHCTFVKPYKQAFKQ